ncbi:unnamed protein product [Nezara viridula]|uniref:Uncharacterized protein n=1 Tax=Nezara viridula TaxID=85310 RepID=A0A9P0HHD2_NEZVI|nr:unnamed protein product [Nezara viridula]
MKTRDQLGPGKQQSVSDVLPRGYCLPDGCLQQGKDIHPQSNLLLMTIYNICPLQYKAEPNLHYIVEMRIHKTNLTNN